MRDMASRTFCALQDAKTPMVIGLVKAGINILLNRLIVDRLEQGRLTLATMMGSGCVMVSVT